MNVLQIAKKGSALLNPNISVCKQISPHLAYLSKIIPQKRYLSIAINSGKEYSNYVRN